MKTIFLFALLIFSFTYSNSQTNSNNLIAACCYEGGRCTGSLYCTACKNCSGCKHCDKNGGSCGVCDGGSRKVYKKYNNNSSSNSSTSFSSNTKTYLRGSYLNVKSANLNLREGPGTKYKIIEKLNNKSILTFIESSGSWLKVKVKKTKTIGYVYHKYVSLWVSDFKNE